MRLSHQRRIIVGNPARRERFSASVLGLEQNAQETLGTEDITPKDMNLDIVDSFMGQWTTLSMNLGKY